MQKVSILMMATVVAVGMVVGASPAWSQSGGATADSAALEAIRSSIDELTSVLREQISAEATREQVQLAIAYLQFRSRRLETLEQDRRRLEDRKATVEGQIEQIQGEVDAGEKKLQDMAPHEAEAWREQLDRMRRAITAEKEDADRLDTRIIDLENEIANGRRRLADFEDFVLENLRLGD